MRWSAPGCRGARRARPWGTAEEERGAWEATLSRDDPTRPASRLDPGRPEKVGSGLEGRTALEDPLELNAMPHRMDDGMLEQHLDAHEIAPARAVELRLELFPGHRCQMPAIARQHVLRELRQAAGDVARILAGVQVRDRPADPFADAGEIPAGGHERVPGNPIPARIVLVTVAFGQWQARGHETLPDVEKRSQLPFVKLDQTAYGPAAEFHGVSPVDRVMAAPFPL